jgi:hypothetical protein
VRDKINSKLKKQNEDCDDLEAIKNDKDEQLKEAEKQATIAEKEHRAAAFKQTRAEEKYSKANDEVTRLSNTIDDETENLQEKIAEINDAQKSFVSGVQVCYL